MKSLFIKMTVIFMVVLVIVFSILTFGLKEALERYFIEEKKEELILHSQSIQEAFLSDSYLRDYNTEDMLKEISKLERYFDTQILMVNTSGFVFINSDTPEALVKQELKLEEIEAIFKGEIIQREGMNKALSEEPVITVGFPIRRGTDQVVLALFVHASVPEVLEANSGIYTIIVTALILGIGLSVGVLFVFTRSLIKAIKALNQGVKAIAGGDYDQQFPIKSRDELGELSQSINVMTQSLKASEAMRREFISDVSHDFRSPLTNIIGYTKGILDGTIPQDHTLKYIQIIEEESERLKALSDDILSLSDLQHMAIDETLIKINLSQMVLGVLDKYSLAFEQKSIDVKVDMTAKDVYMMANEKSIHRMLTNLVDNQVKFTPDFGQVRISISQDPAICLKLYNSGDNLSPALLNNLWKRFCKGDSSRNENKTSFGLGLSIVKEIVELHGGVIGVENQVPTGVTFKIKF